MLGLPSTFVVFIWRDVEQLYAGHTINCLSREDADYLLMSDQWRMPTSRLSLSPLVLLCYIFQKERGIYP